MSDANRIHGISDLGVLGLREIIKGYSLVDITHSGVLASYNKDLPSFLDSAGQIVSSQSTWERSRNQQRNWETLIQVIGIRCQPTIMKKPDKIITDLSDHSFGSDYSGTHCVWCFQFGVEQSNLFDGIEPLGALKKDFDRIPFVKNLNETVNFEVARFDTRSQFTTNLYFEKVVF